MKIKGAIILVELDDEKVYQVDVSSNDVIQYLNVIAMKQEDNKLPILDKPLIGMTFTKVLNGEIRKDFGKNVCIKCGRLCNKENAYICAECSEKVK